MLNPRGVAIIASATLLFALDAIGAGKLTRAEVAGSIVGAKGNVLVDRQPVMAKETVFAGDVISTGAASGAYLNLHGTTAILVENSELALTGTGSSAHITLVKGAVVVRTSSPQATRVEVPGAYVLVRGDGAFPSICRVAAMNSSAVVITDKGSAEIHGAGAPTLVGSGKTVRLEHGTPQIAGDTAGKVVGELPKGTIQHAGKTSELNLNDSVYWQDVVRTTRIGRVRIGLTDGSVLLVGAGSEMTIQKHDAATQQTQIELRAGSVRAIVQKITTPGGKFETKTPTAVIGVVGTTWFANANSKVTGVGSVEGDVTVSNVNPNVVGTVTLHSNQFTTVPFGLPPTLPITLGAGQMNSQLSKTEVHEGINAAAGAGAGGGTTGGLTGAITKGTSNFATVGAAGAGAAFGGVAIGKMGSAGDSLNGANNSLNGAANSNNQAAASSGDAASALNAASSAAAQTIAVETETSTLIQNQQAQGCGCPSPNGPG